MKKSILFSIVLIVSTMLSTGFTSKAQSNNHEIIYDTNTNLRVEFKIYIDDIPVELDDYIFTMTNKHSNITTRILTTNAFTVFLKYDQEYIFKVGHKDYCLKTIELNTTAPKINWVLDWSIYLYPNNPDKYEGKLAYNDVTKKFQHYKQ